MSFSESACDIHLDLQRGPGTTALVAICNNEEGSGLTSEISLDDFIGNVDGRFVWGGRDITQSCRNMYLSRDGPSRLPTLHADLQTDTGKFVSAQCPLDEHIVNINGELLFNPAGME
ncbi:Cyanovirin-N [Aspergillus ambiguus]|uniref:CVNH domain-containing protein n=1 Tax=Aspergillus ambiguus TaxID=176160 RepID=UPI003CCC9460